MGWYADPGTAPAPTDKIVEDTREWRIEADRILGFWDDFLVADPGSDILCTKLHEVFNEWLASNGHNKWPVETFAPRFLQQNETVKYRVQAKQSTKTHRLVNFNFTRPAQTPKRPKVYTGIRFRTEADNEPSGPDKEEW
jgi:phage/plasmid-associated DNA primase